ncbi:MAG: outer membrane protein [Gemmatimonadales bacterium]
MRRYVTLVTLIALVVAPGAALRAQGRGRGLVEVPARPLRAGLYVTGGLGDGQEQYKYSDDPLGYTNWLSSPAAMLRIGGTPSPSVRLGGELFGWWNRFYNADPDIQTHATDSFGVLLLDAQFYPAVRSGFYVKGGLGLARSAESYECCFETVSESGFGWGVGAGYDFQLSRNISIAPTVDFYQGSFSERDNPTITEHVLNIGASITFQSGRRRF